MAPSPTGSEAPRDRARLRLQPGDLVAGRYRLEAPVRSAARPGAPAGDLDTSPAGLWRATDEVLARTVAVKVLCSGAACGPGADDDPLAGEPFLRAAVAAGRLTGTVLARVYDAAAEAWPPAPDDGEDGPAGRLAYVISEWVDGRDLTTVLREDGPFDPVTATRLVATIAEALESAHGRDVVHGRLHPGNVLLLPDGRVKVTDTATSAALPDRGVPAQRTGDPHGPTADVRDLTAVLYALLTARWPASATPQPACGVPIAPTAPDSRRRGRLTSPRQVRAGVPRLLDDLVHRVLDPRLGGPVPQTAAELADALDATLPVERPARPPRRRRRGARRGVAAVVGVLVVGLLAGGGWTLGGGDVLAAVGLDDLLRDDSPAAEPAPSAVPTPAVPVALPTGAVTDFDPPPGSGTERTEEVPLAVDGNPATAWRTERYRSAALGGLKGGVGLLVDLGAPTPVSSVQLSTLAGTAVELRAADARGAQAADYPVLTTGTATGPELTLTPPAGATARYYLVWITTLPPADGAFASRIAELQLLR